MSLLWIRLRREGGSVAVLVGGPQGPWEELLLRDRGLKLGCLCCQAWGSSGGQALQVYRARTEIPEIRVWGLCRSLCGWGSAIENWRGVGVCQRKRCLDIVKRLRDGGARG